MEAITTISAWLAQSMTAIWNAVYSDWGFIGLSIIMIFVLRKVIVFFRKVIKAV